MRGQCSKERSYSMRGQCSKERYYSMRAQCSKETKRQTMMIDNIICSKQKNEQHEPHYQTGETRILRSSCSSIDTQKL